MGSEVLGKARMGLAGHGGARKGLARQGLATAARHWQRCFSSVAALTGNKHLQRNKVRNHDENSHLHHQGHHRHDDAQRKANLDAQAKVGALIGMARKKLAFGDDKGPEEIAND